MASLLMMPSERTRTEDGLSHFSGGKGWCSAVRPGVSALVLLAAVSPAGVDMLSFMLPAAKSASPSSGFADDPDLPFPNQSSTRLS